MKDEIIKFLRHKDYIFIRDIGQGGCAKTILLEDEFIDEQFVCKKYSPANELNKEALFGNFIQEIKLLHKISHNNIVRFFNHYIYPSDKVGYILMEYIEGNNIEDYVKIHPEDINDIFIQAIDGFSYLENNQILHRDIRPYNILITANGVLKIIDFGFGKKIDFGSDYDKSITLNWWCDILPREFNDQIYDHRTEVYFIGKLFEKLILENDALDFKYKELLNKMIEHNENNRIGTFNEIKRSILTDRVDELQFSVDEKIAYRGFATNLVHIYTKIESKSKYKSDIDEIIKGLDKLFRSSMLEEYIQNNSALTRLFIYGSYSYRPTEIIEVHIVEQFLKLLKSSSRDRQNIILNNLWNRLDTITRYTPPDDDLPF